MTLQSSLHAIGLRHAAVSIEAIIAEGVREALSHHDLLAIVAKTEADQRAARSYTRRLGKSHLGRAAPVADFDFAHPTRIDRAQIDQAFTLHFIAEGGSVLFIAPSGLGKTHLAKALIHAALAAGHRALFIDAIDALDDLATAKDQGRLKSRLRYYLRPHLLCLDAIAYQQIDIARLDLLYELVRRRYDLGRALVITTPLAFAQWPSAMPSTAATAALVDRLVHRAVVINIEGTSYRRREAQERAAKAR